jgi:hypothetical protein
MRCAPLLLEFRRQPAGTASHFIVAATEKLLEINTTGRHNRVFGMAAAPQSTIDNLLAGEPYHADDLNGSSAA